jgi:hypothetical protein
MTVECGRAGSRAGSVLRLLGGGLLAGLALIEGGCGNDVFTYGTPVMVLSNSAPGPFTSYIAAIISITFTRNDGTVVQPIIPTGTGEEQVDYANLTTTSELMGAPAALTGTYTTATITLDYTSAQVEVNVNGKPQAATLVDDTGAALTTVAYNVTFDPAHPLVLTQYNSTLLDVNFDLSASSVINTATSPVQVVVRPFMTISTVPAESKPIRARGVFVATNPGASNFIMNTLPFFDISSQPFGSLTVQTSPQTTYNINGISYTGAAGLTALQGLQVNAIVSANGTLGSLANVTPVFNATQIFAGSSLEDQAQDRVRGVVSSRSGNTLHIHGVTVFDRFGIVTSQPDIPMTVGSDTVVSIDGEPNAKVNAQSISVGQAIDAGGILTPPAGQAGIYSSEDATQGVVRLTPTPLWGTLNAGAAPGTASLNVVTLGDFQPSAFSFAGTGSSSASNANPAAYSVNTSSVDLSGTPAGTLLLMNGAVSAFGGAPPDFVATSVTPGSATDQALIIDYLSDGSIAPFLSRSDSDLVVSIDSARVGSSHVVETGPVSLDLKALNVNPRIVPDTTRTGQFAIGNPTTGLTEFNTFSAFSTQIGKLLNGSNALHKLVAIGHYDSADSTFTAYRIDLVQQ